MNKNAASPAPHNDEHIKPCDVSTPRSPLPVSDRDSKEVFRGHLPASRGSPQIPATARSV